MCNSCQRKHADVRNEPLPLFLSHPLPLEANKILLLSWCPFTNWMKQNGLESNKSSKWIWLLWNTNRVLWVHFRKAKKKITGADLDHYLWALKTIFFHSSEIRTLRHLRHFFLRSFLKFSQCGLILSWKMGASLFKYIFISISELAPAALPCSLGSSIITIKAKKGGF